MERKYIYYRVFAYIFTIFIHVYSIINTLNNFTNHSSLSPELMKRYHLRLRYLTVWNAIFQIAYAAIGLLCDLYTLRRQEKLITQRLERFRYPFFNAIVFPYSMTVSSVFWPVYFYDRKLIFPKECDFLLSRFDNHVAHTLIVPIALWDLIFQPRLKVSHKNNCIYIFLMYVIYNSVLFYSRYGDLGYWAYDIITVLEGTNYIYLFFAYIFFCLYTSYFAQWYIKDLFGVNTKMSSKKI